MPSGCGTRGLPLAVWDVVTSGNVLSGWVSRAPTFMEEMQSEAERAPAHALLTERFGMLARHSKVDKQNTKPTAMSRHTTSKKRQLWRGKTADLDRVTTRPKPKSDQVNCTICTLRGDPCSLRLLALPVGHPSAL